MKELKSQEIKNSISRTLLDIAPECTVYTEAMNAPEYPHLFVHLISADDTYLREGYHNLKYSFDVRYRVASDPSEKQSVLQGMLDDMALRLFGGLNIIESASGDGTKWRCEEKNYEKTDGVLHFFFKITAQIKIVPKDESGRLGKLERVNIRGKK